MRIGILGGAFNPVHNGHLAIADLAYKELKLDRLFFVPSNFSVYKNNSLLLSQKHRLNMLELALKNTPYEILTCEFERGGNSYTYDTVEYIYSHFDCAGGVYIIIGDDHLSKLHTWKNIEDMLLMADFVVFRRDKNVFERDDIDYMRLENDFIPISSTDVRNKILLDSDISHLIPQKVLEYIKENKLYL